MSNYRRAKLYGGYYAFTVVTFKRKRFLTDKSARICLRSAIERVRNKHKFKIIAFCLLPDHLHCIWKLPQKDNDFSTSWSLIKRYFTKDYLDNGGTEESQSLSRTKHRHRGIWQRRFWEHQIRDEKDLQEHINYVHYNPVKHALVEEASQWPWSTYHKYVESGGFGKVDLNNIQGNINDLFNNE